MDHSPATRVAERAALFAVSDSPGRAPGAAVPKWAYTAPAQPAAYPDQRYYRADERRNHIAPVPRHRSRPTLTLFRFASEDEATLEVAHEFAVVKAVLDRAALLALRDAANDALQDLAALDAEAQHRDESGALA